MTKITSLTIELILTSLIFAAPITNEADAVMINSHGTIMNETGDNSTNNQNGFNEGSFDEANFGFGRGIPGNFGSGGAVAVPLQGAAPAPIAFGGQPTFVAVPHQGGAPVIVGPGGPGGFGGFGGFGGPGPRGERIVQEAKTGLLNGRPEVLSHVATINKLPNILNLNADVEEEVDVEEEAIEEFRAQ